MNHPKSHVQPAQRSHNLGSRGRAKAGLIFNTKMATLNTCVTNSNIGRCEGAVALDALVLQSEFRHLRLPVPEKALTRDHIG